MKNLTNYLKVSILIIISGFGVPSRLFAQSTDSTVTTTHLTTLTVTATRMPQEPNHTGRHVTMVQGTEIANLPVTTIDELLRYLPGIEVQSRNGFGAQSDIVMRGSTFAQVLVLIDGMRLNDPLTGHFNAYIPVPLSEIERIEVLYGAASSVYGPDAVGGVVNIITKTFSQVARADSVHANAQIKAGDYGLWGTEAGVFYKKGKIRAGLGMQNHYANGHPGRLQNNYFDVRNIATSVAYQPTKKLSMGYRTAYDYRDFSAQNFYTVSPYDQSTERVTGLWNHFNAQLNHNQQTTTRLDVAHKRSTDWFLFMPSITPNTHTTHFANAQLVQTHRMHPKLSLVYGLQADYRQINSNDRGNHSATHSAVFALAQYQPTTRLTIMPSLRADQDANYGLELLPQLNAAWHRRRITLRASTGRTIRAADFTERYNNYMPTTVAPLRNIGNPNLNAEVSWSHEIGIDLNPTKGLAIKGTYFYRTGSNIIDYVPTNANQIANNHNLMPDTNYLWAQNLLGVNTTGFESQIWYRKYLGTNSNVDVRLGYININTQTGTNQVSKYISNHARHLLTLSTYYTHQRFTLGLNGLYKQRPADHAEGIAARLTQSYSVWNAQIGYQLPLKATNLKINAQVNNIFDAKFSDLLGAQMPGRWLVLGLSWRFSAPTSTKTP